MEKQREIEKSIITTFKTGIWKKFTAAVTEYRLIEDGDRIAVCISGGKDSFLMAKCFQELKKHGRNNFEVVFMAMDPGYNEENRRKIEENAELLGVPLDIFESDIFTVVEYLTGSPCYMCARMRRGHLYNHARELGCNKIALGHHFNDVIETILMGMLYNGQIQTMMPKLHSSNFPGMELIRPMYRVAEADILAWKKSNNLSFIQCACRFTENCVISDDDPGGSKRREMKQLIKVLKKSNPNADINIFNSVYNINLNAVIGVKKGGQRSSFLDEYDKNSH